MGSSTKHLDEQLTVVFHSLPAPLVLLEAINNQSGEPIDFSCIYLNKKALKSFNLIDNQQQHKSLQELFPGNYETFRKECISVFNNGCTRNVEKGNIEATISKLDDNLIFSWREITPALEDLLAKVLREGEELFRTLADNISQLAWITDKNGNPVWFNQRWSEFTGYSNEELLRLGTIEFHHPDYFEKAVTKYIDCISKGESWEDIYPMKGRDSVYKWFLGRALPIPSKEGEINRWFGTATDITEQKKLQEDLHTALKEREVLLKELHHRTKNNMQIISSLLSIKGVGISSPETLTVFQEIQSRIRAIALVHEKLYRSENLSMINLHDYIRDLVQLLIYSSSSNVNKIKFKYDLEEDIRVTIDTAIPCGLVVTELVLNSIKHAFPDNRAGVIEIKLQTLENEIIQLIVCDNGVGLSEASRLIEENKLGLQLFKDIVENQLNGTSEMTSINGLMWTVKFRNLQ